MNRIRGLDSIRFICAMIVVIGHLHLPRPDLSPVLGNVGSEAVRALMGCSFNGPAAVIVFFIVSGFCIHLPFRNATSIPLASYYSRRIIRICGPALFAVVLYRLLGVELEAPTYGVFWSVICELVYYILYPALLRLRRLTSWTTIILLAVFGFVVNVAVHADVLAINKNYSSLGATATWIFGLPCWLTGCWLAENYQRFPQLSTSTMWLVRLGVFCISFCCMALRFHVDYFFTSNVILLSPAAIIAGAWLGLEIAYFFAHEPSERLETLGVWSFSLYMIHPLAPALTTHLGLDPTSPLGALSNLLIGLATSYVFYWIVEKPFHKTALTVSRMLKPTSPVSEPLATIPAITTPLPPS